jgi:drug/metabolite transporter (DMT)-like permease
MPYHRQAMKDRLDGFAITVLLVCSVAWGLNQVAVKLSIAGIPPVLGAGLRSVVAGVLLLGWCAARGERLFARDGTGPYGLLLGLMFSAEFVFLYWGLAFTTASRSVIFLYMAPFLVALGAHWLIPGERLTAPRAIGLGLAFAGLCLAFADALTLPGRRELVGDLLETLAAILWAATTVLVKRVGYHAVTPDRALFYQLAISGPLLIALSVAIGERAAGDPSPLVLAALAYQGVVVAFASYLAWFWLLARYPASGVAAYSFWTPLVGVLAGALVLGERLTGYLGGAVALVAGGIYLVNRQPR